MKTSALAACSLVAVLAATSPALAEFKVKSPIVEQGELELETTGSVGRDSRTDHDKEISIVNSFGYGVTDYWGFEIEGEMARDPGQGNETKYNVTTIGNKFTIFPQGEQWLDVGFWAEYGLSGSSHSANNFKFGPLLQKSIGRTTTTVNFFFEKEVGAYSTGGADATYAGQFRYDWYNEFAPAIEVYGDLGDFNGMHAPDNQQHRLGPVLTGKFSFGGMGELKYEVGYLVGLTTATPTHTLKWGLEYEIAF